MKYIGAHLGHDATIVALDDTGSIIFYAQAERYSRFKNHGFEADPIGHAFPNIIYPDPGDIVAIAAIEQPSHPEWRGCINVYGGNEPYDPSLARPYKPKYEKNFFKKSLSVNPNFAVNHHLCHILAAWCFRENDNPRLALSYDGAGFDPEGLLRCFLVGKMSSQGFEAIEDAVPIPSSLPLVGLLGYHSAGKAMGLAGYMPKEPWTDDQTMKLIQAGFDELYEPKYPFFKPEEMNDENMQFVANLYRWYTAKMGQAVGENIEKFKGDHGVVIGGGTTLALEMNTKIHQMVDGDVVFAPPTDDSGLALGAAAWAYWHGTGKWIKVNTPSLNDLQDPLPQIGPQEPRDIAKLLADDKVVGLMRGKSEAGPRALGFRSILAEAKADNLKRVSQDLKEREFYRPLAPMVTTEQFDRFFTGPQGKYMQYRTECTEEAKELLPAICHRDNSARPQVVNKEDDPWLHELLVEYGQLSGAECLINTSLNKKKKPICNTYEDVRREMRGKELEMVCLPHESWSPPVKGPIERVVQSNLNLMVCASCRAVPTVRTQQ